MHETIVASKIIEQAKKKAREEGRKDSRINTLVLECGDLAEVTARELAVALNQLIDWDIAVQEKKALVKCECSYKGEPNILERGHHVTLFECPSCKTIPQVIDGDKIKIKEISFE